MVSPITADIGRVNEDAKVQFGDRPEKKRRTSILGKSGL